MTPEEIREALERRARRPGGKPRAAKRLPKPSPPDGPERGYSAALARLNKDLVGVVRAFLARPFERARERQDAPGDLDPFAGLDFGTLKIRLGRMVENRAGELAETFGTRAGRWNGREVARVLGINLATSEPAIARALEEWQRENIALITSIADRLHDDVFETVRDATRRGARVETLASELAERYGVSESRARLIAEDQTLSINAELTRIRHETAGISRYAWSTSLDEKVRPTHQALEGRIFSWDAPPVSEPDGSRHHPGQAVRCRCQAIPILDP